MLFSAARCTMSLGMLTGRRGTRLGRQFGWDDVNPVTYLQKAYSGAWNWYYGQSNSTPVPPPPAPGAQVPIYVYFDKPEEEQQEEKLKNLQEEVSLSLKTSLKLIKKYVWMYPKYSFRVAYQAAWVFVDKYFEFGCLFLLLLIV